MLALGWVSLCINSSTLPDTAYGHTNMASHTSKARLKPRVGYKWQPVGHIGRREGTAGALEKVME